MIPQAVIVMGVGLFGLGVVFGFVAYLAGKQEQQQRRHQYRQEPLPQPPPAPRPKGFGPCGICGGEVLDESYPLPCNHHSHPTCATDITLSQGHLTFNWADVCRNCMISRVEKDVSTRTQKNEGLRNRGINRQICGHCRKGLLEGDETQELACLRHQVHKTCGDAMETSGYTTCPMCMIEM